MKYNKQSQVSTLVSFARTFTETTYTVRYTFLYVMDIYYRIYPIYIFILMHLTSWWRCDMRICSAYHHI